MSLRSIAYSHSKKCVNQIWRILIRIHFSGSRACPQIIWALPNLSSLIPSLLKAFGFFFFIPQLLGVFRMKFFYQNPMFIEIGYKLFSKVFNSYKIGVPWLLLDLFLYFDFILLELLKRSQTHILLNRYYSTEICH